jgi:hypothetical protein
MVAEGLPAQLACRVLDVSEPGFHAWRTRAPSQRSIRHALLTDLIRQIHADFRGVYGYRRVPAELTSDSSPTASSAACGPTTGDSNNHPRPASASLLDKGASQRALPGAEGLRRDGRRAVRTIFAQPDAAHDRFQLLGDRFPDLAAMLEDAAEDLLAFTGFPSPTGASSGPRTRSSGSTARSSDAPTS